ncbi:odorant receptor 67c-like [Melanaphis sacchari]|uniref:odorant receptor 67c-like n=1 Tax=Melanaphis sacchari TaxID=742174 RepID=UPI000DC1404D|nr:odorant receptor 67c-like [Melanaphis sacchari]
MMQSSDYLSFAYNFLRWIGVFQSSDSTKWTRLALNFYRLIIFIILTLLTILMLVQMFITTDLTLLARTIDIWTLFFSGLYKWLYMTAFNWEFSHLKFALTQLQTQGSMAYGRSADVFTADYLKQMRKISCWYLFSGFVAAFFISVNPLFTLNNDQSDFQYYNDPKSYPFICWIPFTLNENWMFLAIFACHIIASFLIAAIYLGIDIYFFGAIYAVGGQIKLLNTSLNNNENNLAQLENFSCSNQPSIFTEKQLMLCYSTLRECLKHHILALDYIKSISKLFSTLILMDYLHGITSLTFALFQLTISTSIAETITVICFICVSVWHQYLNNFFGEFIIQKQISVSTTLYNVPWWRCDKKIRQLVTLMILRSTKPTVVTGYYMYKLSYKSFISFVKALYTYYMVLKRVNIQDTNI